MEFRWVAGITLWTLLSGPVFVGVQQFVSPSPASKVDSAPLTWNKVVKAPAGSPRPLR